MAKVSPLQSNFGGGEFSPLLYGRVDNERYNTALSTCLNYIPMIQGGLTRRPGTMWVAPVKDSSKFTRLISFEFSVTQAYVIELGEDYARFYRNNAAVLNTAKNITAITQANPGVVTVASHGYASGAHVEIVSVGGMTQLNGRRFRVGTTTTNTFELLNLDGTNLNTTTYSAYTSGGTSADVYEIVMPYDEEDLETIKFTQSADVLYLVHPLYAPRKLSRTADNAWTLSTLTFLDGPYLNPSTTGFTLTPSAASGTGVTLTASGSVFSSSDVGRLIRIREGSTWGYVTITAFTSATVVTVTVNSTLTNTNAKLIWRLGVYSSGVGYPSAVTFHEDRLFFSGAAGSPQRLDGSNSGDYENFAPSANDGTVSSSNAVSFSLNANDVNVIRWIASDEKGMLAGTVGGEWVVRAASINEALSPTNISAKPATRWGSADIQPVVVGKAALFVQKAARKLREMNYFYEVDGHRAIDLSVLAEHISASGIRSLAYQKEPQSIVWAVRNDGALIGMTYERDLDSLKVGWHRHVIGGVSDAANNIAEVESITVLPSADLAREDLWMVVKRRINGSVVRYVEYLTRLFDDQVDQRDAFFVDSGLTYDSPIVVTGIQNAAVPEVLTSTVHGFTTGDRVRFSEIEGMKELNDVTCTIIVTGVSSFTLDVDTTLFSQYVSGGEVRELVTNISGLWHLEGQTVDILADGAVLPSKVVTNGAITLTVSSAVVQIGLGYNSDAQMLRLEAGSQNGTALGKTRRTHRVGFYMHRSLGLKYGMDFSDLTTLPFRTSSDLLTRAVPLFSGILSENISANYDFENQICWRQSQPLPSTILAVMPQMVTQDRG